MELIRAENGFAREQRAVMECFAFGGRTPKVPSHEEIARRAYQRWEAGGCQPGMAELDWIRAEEDLTGASL